MVPALLLPAWRPALLPASCHGKQYTASGQEVKLPAGAANFRGMRLPFSHWRYIMKAWSP
jgi:hypothetical protein